MASGDTKTNQYLDVAANGSRADLPSDTCCETRTQTLIRGVAERIMDVEEEVEEIKNNPDVVDIVDTYADLEDYDTSGLTDKDIVRVIADETKGGLSSYYRWNSPSPGWNFVGVIPGGDGIKELSSADYNYPTANPDRVALWLLDNGLYTAPAGVMVAASTASYPWYNTSDKTILVGGSDTVKGIYTFLNGKVDVVTTQVSDGVEADEYTLLKSTQVLQATGQSTTDTMSQKATTDAINAVAIRGSGAPTTSTTGTVGQLYEDTTNGDLYQLKSIDTTVTPNTYNWEEVGGGSGPTVVQTIGTSTTDVMSQNAVTSMVFADPAAQTKIKIGAGANVNEGWSGIEIGSNASCTGGAAIAIGRAANAGTGGGNVAIGQNATGTSGGYNYSVSIGNSSLVSGSANGIAIGFESTVSNAVGGVAIGAGAKATQGGQVDFSAVGVNTIGTGYNNSNYRLLTGLYDGQSAHDAATLAQGNTLATSAPTTSTVGVLGQLYTDTTNMHTYQCTAISGSTYTWTQRW